MKFGVCDFMRTEKRALISIIVIILFVIYGLYEYLPETGAEAKYLSEMATMIKNKEYSKLNELQDIEMSEDHKAEKENLLFYAQALQAKDSNDIPNFKYFLFRIPKDYEGRLSEEIEQSREEADKLFDEYKANEAKERKAKEKEEKQKANEVIIADVQNILNDIPSQKDNVQRVTWWRSWGSNGYPAKDAAYWYVGEKNGRYWVRAFLVDFDDSINWVFWDRVTFSTDEENWTYFIKNCFAGQNGGGKSTNIVRGGKYETLDVSLDEVEYGYLLLTKGHNPIIRFESNKSYHDYYLTADDINSLNTGLYLNAKINQIKY